MAKIEFVTHDSPIAQPFSEETLQSWLESVALSRQYAIHYITYILCSDEYVLELNQKHLNHHDYTDILTFPYNYNPIESEIFISMERVRDNAQTLGVSFNDEFLRISVHGLLHMMGYKDHSAEEKAEMRSAENEAIDLFHRNFAS